MKKLHLKNGMDFTVLLEIQEETKGRKISLHDFSDDLLAEIFEPKFNRVVIHGVNCKPYEIQAIAEISENFDWYYNNLNQ